MTTTLANRFASLAAVSTIALLHTAGATAAPKTGAPIFDQRTTADSAQLPALAKAKSGFTGKLNPSVMSASAIDVTLDDGQIVTARLQRVVRDDNKQVQSWIGTFDDAGRLISERVAGGPLDDRAVMASSATNGDFVVTGAFGRDGGASALLLMWLRT